MWLNLCGNLVKPSSWQVSHPLRVPFMVYSTETIQISQQHIKPHMPLAKNQTSNLKSSSPRASTKESHLPSCRHNDTPHTHTHTHPTSRHPRRKTGIFVLPSILLCRMKCKDLLTRTTGTGKLLICKATALTEICGNNEEYNYNIETIFPPNCGRLQQNAVTFPTTGSHVPTWKTMSYKQDF